MDQLEGNIYRKKDNRYIRPIQADATAERQSMSFLKTISCKIRGDVTVHSTQDWNLFPAGQVSNAFILQDVRSINS
jgi:hypothetical protein